MVETVSGRTVFVLGAAITGNQEVLVLENGDTYEIDPDTISSYTAQEARFPYEVAA